jgi:hypothetical protein
MTIDPEIEAAIMWSCSEYPGLERLVVRRAKSGGGHQLAGHALIALAGEQFDIGYQIEVDADWRTQSARIEIDGSRQISIAVSAEGGGHWQIAGAETEPDIYLQDILDIDLGFTPATNLLPIRRLDLAVGESAPVSAHWLQFPSLAFARLDQRYTRLTPDRYRYESDTGYVTEITVDDFSIPVDYGDVWKRIDPSERGTP